MTGDVRLRKPVMGMEVIRGELTVPASYPAWILVNGIGDDGNLDGRPWGWASQDAWHTLAVKTLWIGVANVECLVPR